jgi:hypothetical protein
MIDLGSSIAIAARGQSEEEIPKVRTQSGIQWSFSTIPMYNSNYKILEAPPMIEEVHFLCTLTQWVVD